MLEQSLESGHAFVDVDERGPVRRDLERLTCFNRGQDTLGRLGEGHKLPRFWHPVSGVVLVQREASSHGQQTGLGVGIGVSGKQPICLPLQRGLPAVKLVTGDVSDRAEVRAVAILHHVRRVFE